jgi:predicted RNA-binding protein with PUA-like domain
MLVDVKVTQKIPLIALSTLREQDELADMILLRKGNRLSVMPVTTAEWNFITKNLIKKNG